MVGDTYIIMYFVQYENSVCYEDLDLALGKCGSGSSGILQLSRLSASEPEII